MHGAAPGEQTLAYNTAFEWRDPVGGGEGESRPRGASRLRLQGLSRSGGLRAAGQGALDAVHNAIAGRAASAAPVKQRHAMPHARAAEQRSCRRTR